MGPGEWCDRVASLDPVSLVDPSHPDYCAVDDYFSRVCNVDLPAVQFVRDFLRSHARAISLYGLKWRDLEESRSFAKLDVEVQRDVVIAATALATANSRLSHCANRLIGPLHQQGHLDQEQVNRLLRRADERLLGLLVTSTPSVKQPWDEASLLLLFKNLPLEFSFSMNRIVRLCEAWANKQVWTDKLAKALLAIVDRHSRYDPALRDRARDIGKKKPSKQSSEPREFELKPCDSWTAKLVDCLNARDETVQHAWTQLLAHCETAKSSSPSKTFLRKATERIEAIGEEHYVDVMVAVLESIGTAYKEDVAPHRAPDDPYDPTMVEPTRADLLRGLVWTTSLIDNKWLLAAASTAADRCFQKVRNVGPRAPKIGNACLWVFAHTNSLEAVSQLNRLLGRVKHASVRKQIERSLVAAAEHHGITRSDLEDMAVPPCGLTEVGVARQAFGDYAAELRILSTSMTRTEWHTPAGKVQKTVPKAVKEQFAAELKAWKTNEKLLKQTLAGQRDRLESFYLANKQWSYDAWRERMLDHPLMGWFARRLIWTVQSDQSSVPALWHETQLVDSTGSAVGELQGDAIVKLWHPIGSTPEAIQVWREWMLQHEITQPFKQAYREIYLLTDAERSTDTYSNRFAAHVIKQHQFRALCQARGWQYDLMGQWDSHNVPEKVLPAHNLRVEFWVEAAGGEQASEMGIFLYLATDQVRFYPCDAEAYARDRWSIQRGAEPLPLDQVPPLVLSEVLRDVDLFVGVASVGNDPNWNDGGPEGQYRDYWHETSFGDLSATAQTRREILERLVPRLKIADRCSFDDKFIIVRGDRRTYKIHLGSSNILMEPNDQYLCIVPGRGAGPGDKVFLPFEGDQRLAVILSKAMMLADDSKIKDSTILSQIGRD